MHKFRKKAVQEVVLLSTPHKGRMGPADLIDGLLRVTLTDGRVLVGTFSCFDKQRNILLQDAREFRILPEDGGLSESSRSLGIVLVPRRWIAACHAPDVS